VRRTVLPLLITVIVAACGLIGASPAFADGDPASDILVTQTLFMPWDASIQAQAQAQLAATITAANKAGFPIRVALIASTTDLGTETALWKQLHNYAYFLGTELSDLYSGQLLVVMPNGFGLYGPDAGAHTVSGKEAAVTAPTPGTGDHMAEAATLAVQRLAAAAGHSFTARTVRTKAPAASGGGSDWVTWLALLVGALAILLAWGASLKARPPQWRRRAQA
jgi:hypothetical protein